MDKLIETIQGIVAVSILPTFLIGSAFIIGSFNMDNGLMNFLIGLGIAFIAGLEFTFILLTDK